MDLTSQFLRAGIHGAALREHLALLFGSRLASCGWMETVYVSFDSANQPGAWSRGTENWMGFAQYVRLPRLIDFRVT